MGSVHIDGQMCGKAGGEQPVLRRDSLQMPFQELTWCAKDAQRDGYQ